MVKFWEGFTKFMKPVTLFEEFISYKQITAIKVFQQGTSSSNSNKLENVYTVWSRMGHISIQKRIINNAKIKIFPFVVNTRRNLLFVIQRLRSKNDALLFEMLALFKVSSYG